MTHDSLVQTVGRLLERNAHLYTSGREQAEPADAGTDGTKDENLSDLNHLIIEVAALK